MAIWFVSRKGGAIVWAGQYQQPGYADEQLNDAISAELIAFLTPTAQQAAIAQLQANDAATFRMLEALADVLLSKNVTAGQPLIVGTDFRADIRALYLARKAIRVTAGVP